MKNIVIGLLLLTPPLLGGSKYNSNEIKALQLSKQWINKRHLPKRGKNGVVVFAYGDSQPRIVCSPLNVCDIQFEKGEVIIDKFIGDQVRWKVQPAIVGRPPNSTSHIIVKPIESGLETTLIITTDRRIYHMNLKSSEKRYMARVAFEYEDLEEKWDQYFKVVKPSNVNYIDDHAKKVINSNSSLDLYFEYEVEGDASWRPLRVFNNGRQTIIHMPEVMKITEAPTLLVVDSNDNEILVNNRLKENMFVVDQIFKKAILIVGVGSDQERVTIELKGDFFKNKNRKERIQNVNKTKKSSKNRLRKSVH